MDKLTRREFLKCGGLGAAALMVVPSSVLGKKFGHVAPWEVWADATSVS